MIYRAHVVITLREGVVDPQGEAARDALARLGLEGVRRVRVGKSVHLELEADDEEAAQVLVEQACQKLLVSPAVEEYRFRLEAVGEPGA